MEVSIPKHQMKGGSYEKEINNDEYRSYIVFFYWNLFNAISSN